MVHVVRMEILEDMVQVLGQTGIMEKVELMGQEEETQVRSISSFLFLGTVLL
jgi:hypothetical protein